MLSHGISILRRKHVSPITALINSRFLLIAFFSFFFSRTFYLLFLYYILMMSFSIGIGLEHGGNVGLKPELPLGRSTSSGSRTPLQKTRNKEDRRELARRYSDA